ncbi:hypothetical protein [Nakamurella sp.]|uniref:hypothetical protein n=1 Tax=Nakamurella sp. TaxID=1869182 RepID=UPI003B3B7318
MPDDPTAAAVDELYGGDPDDFLARRTDLAARARAAGDAAAAKRIAALRKPTRSAFAINRLARTDPEAVGQLLDLGRDWQTVQASATAVDARRIRELTRSRRRLIDDLTRAAFAAADESHPSSAARDEVVSTLTAALSDDSVADEIERGVLVKPARWEGFGLGGPELTLVPGGQDSPPEPDGDHVADSPTGPEAGGTGRRSGRASTATSPTTASPARPRPTPAERRAAREAEQQAQAERAAAAAREAARAREATLAQARQAADEAEETLILATDEEQARVDRVHELEDQLSEARQAVDRARREVRRAELAQRRARDALRRLEPES